MLEDMQHLEHHDAAAGRRVGRDAVAAVFAPQRFVVLGRGAAQVFEGQQAAAAFHVGGDGPCDFAPVEHLDAVLRDAPECPRHVGVLEDRAGLAQGAAIVEIDPPPRGREAQALDVVDQAEGLLAGPELVDVGPDHEAVLGVADGRRECVLPVERAVAAQRLVIGLEAARRGDRLVTEVVDLAAQLEAEAVLRLPFDEVGPHLRPRLGRRPAVEVEAAVHAPPGQVEV